MQERRILGETIDLSLSTSSVSIKAASTTKTTTVYCNDEILKNSSVTISNSYTSWVTASYSSSTGVVTFSISANTDTSNGRTAYIYIKYKGKSSTYTISLSKDTVKSTSTTYSYSLKNKTNQTGYDQSVATCVLCTYTFNKTPRTTSTYYSGNTVTSTGSSSQISLSMNWSNVLTSSGSHEWMLDGGSGSISGGVQLYGGWAGFATSVSGRLNMTIKETDPVGSYVKCKLTLKQNGGSYTEYYTDSNFYTITRTSNGATITYGS